MASAGGSTVAPGCAPAPGRVKASRSKACGSAPSASPADGPFGEPKNFVEVSVEVFEHFSETADQPMSIFSGLAYQYARSGIWIAAQTDVAIVSNPSIVLKDVSTLDHHL